MHSQIFLLFIVQLTLTLPGWSAVSAHLQCFCKQQECDRSKCRISWSLLTEKITGKAESCSQDMPRLLSGCLVNTSLWDEVCECSSKDCEHMLYYMRRFLDKYEVVCEREASKRYDPVFTSHWDHPSYDDLEVDTGPKANKHLILLVVIPLSVGALAVVMICLNYHCKMC
uniref:GDNF/GAS1 domain-containing protein n=1 Tax=Trichuris muris TaxID=70415 RepID=A0A5S6QX42_TRIMR